MSENVEAPLKNPLLERIRLPGETFTLPSGGLFYNNGELGPHVTNAEVRVYPMTAIDEITIKTPDMLFSGDAIREVFERCIPDIANVDMLLAKDIDFLIVCLRKITYGDEYRVKHTHTCEEAKEHTYSIDIANFIRESKRIDPTTISTKFNINLSNGQVVHLQPLRFKHFVDVMQASDYDDTLTPALKRDRLIKSISNVISAVDEVTNVEFIREWLKSISSDDIKKINNGVEKTMDWGAGLEMKTNCKDCNNSMQITAPMNPLYFFT